jgi:septum formation protein
MTVRFILASSSPARRETLTRAGITPEIIVSGLDESSIEQESNTPAEYAQLLANTKAKLVVAEIRGEALVLGCDSLLEFDGEAMGKPGTIAAAMERWRRMRGKRGVLHTGHCLMDVAAERVCVATVSTPVHFADLSDEEIEAYCSSGEPSNVAGGFTIDGYGGWFIEGIEGDPHNVVGVSLPVLRRMMAELNVRLTDVGYPAF